jgi:AcrR family transcriptional regulator
MAGFDTRTEGRKSAYVARNRTAIVKAAQEVLASDGSDATVESVAVLSEMSVSTIYKHFPKREDLFHTALLSGINEWESWAIGLVGDITDPIERLLFPMRLQVKLPETHPTFAKMVAADVAFPPSTGGIGRLCGHPPPPTIPARVAWPEVVLVSADTTYGPAEKRIHSHQLLHR